MHVKYKRASNVAMHRHGSRPKYQVHVRFAVRKCRLVTYFTEYCSIFFAKIGSATDAS